MNCENLDRELGLELLPYSISASLYLTINETNRVRQLHLLLHSYRHLVHFLALCHISDYLRYSNTLDPEIEEIIAGLKRPSLGHWVRVIRDVPKILLKKNKSLFIDEWPYAWRQLEKLRYKKCIGLDIFAPRVELTAIEALLRLRNTLAHGGIMPDENLCEELYQYYFIILKDIVNTLKFLQEIIVYRVVSQDNEYLNVVEMRGPKQPFPSKTLKRIISFPGNNIVPECFLGKQNQTADYFSLIPMLIASLEEQQDSAGFSEPLLSYDGLGKKRVYYLGIKRIFESESHYDDVFSKLFDRPIAKLSCWTILLATTIISNTREAISINRGAKYFPEIFQKRQRYFALIHEFLGEMPSKVAGLLFVAESGVGKTSLLCHLSVELLNNEEYNPLPLLVMCKNFRIDNAYCQETYRQGELGALGSYLKDILGFKEVNNWDSLVEKIASNINTSLDQVQPKLALMIDAINEAPDPLHLLQEFDYVVRLARKFPWLRCIGTIRKGTYEILLAKLVEKGIKWPTNERAYVREPDDNGKLNISVVLSSFSESETRHTYESYQKQAEAGIDIPACLTAYQDLPEVLRQIIRHPLIMGILMQTYNNQPVSSNLAPTGLFEEFHNKCITSSQATTVAYIANCCLETGRPYLSPVNTQKLLEAWKKDKDEYELLVCLDPIEQLLDLGILILNSQGEYSFAHQLYLEFLLFRNFLSLNLQHQELFSRIDNIMRQPEIFLEEEIGALRMLILEKIKQGEYQLINSLIKLLSSEIFCQFFTPLVLELMHLDNEAYQIIEKEVLLDECKPILEHAIKIYQTIGDRIVQLNLLQKLLSLEEDIVLKSFLEVKYIRLLIMSNRISDARLVLEKIKLLTDFSSNILKISIYIEEGYMNFVIADSKTALQAYSNALNLLEESRDLMEEEEYLLKKCEIVGGRGCVEHNIDDNEACLTSHKEALKIDRQLSKREAIALDLVNVADAYWGCHSYGQSLLVYQDAIEAAAKTCYQDAMDVALIGRGIVLWSIGRLAEADESITAGLEIARQLNYYWDLSYGLIYKSNIEASQKDIASAIETNKQALELAEEVGAEYLMTLASAYLFEKYEVINPGLPETKQAIEDSLKTCHRLQLQGVALMLRTVHLLNMIASKNIADKEIENNLKQLLDMLVQKPLIKGAWELMGLRLIGAMKRWRGSLDTIEIEDIIDEICERKASSFLNQEDSAVYLASRKPWKLR